MSLILIVEDVPVNLDYLTKASLQVLPKYISGFSKEHVYTAGWFDGASNLIAANSYAIVLLDHLMPRFEPQVVYGHANYFLCLEEIGYELIPVIREKHPSTVIIGTSSSLKLSRFAKPNFSLEKSTVDSMAAQLERILPHCRL